MANKTNKEIEEIIIILHKSNKTPTEISKIVNMTPNGIRLLLKRLSFTPYSKPKRDRSRPCVICNKIFIPVYDDGIKKDGCKTCSKGCSSKLFASHKVKYTQNQINQVIELKKQNIPNKIICEKVNMNICKVKSIVKENKLYLTQEQIQKNAQEARIKKGTSSKSYEEYHSVMESIEKDILANKGTAHGLASKYDINPNTVTGFFRNQKKNHLLGIKESTGQKFLYEFVCELLGEENVKYNDRTVIKPKELDIYIPSKNIGIEYNGLHWHTENKIGKNSHFDKMRTAQTNNIRLITIFAHEWYNKSNQIKNFLKSVLGISTTKIAARKTIIKEVNREEAKEFLEKNHIQGAANTSIVFFGIFYENKLNGIMSFGNHHRADKNNTNLILDRLCFLDGVSIQGGASKLISCAIKWAKLNGYKKIISWSDNRWSEGNVYKKMGFILEEELKPDYFYTKNGLYFSKQSCQKKNLLKKGAIGNTEKEMAISIGLERVYDCGKKRWRFNII